MEAGLARISVPGSYVSQYCRSEEPGRTPVFYPHIIPSCEKVGDESVSPDPLGDRRGGPFAKLQWHNAQQFPIPSPGK